MLVLQRVLQDAAERQATFETGQTKPRLGKNIVLPPAFEGAYHVHLQPEQTIHVSPLRDAN